MSVVSLNERRKYPRISEAVALRLHADSTTTLDPAPTHVVKISCGGLRFFHSTAMDAETKLKLCMHLSSCNRTVHLNCRVISSGEENKGGFSNDRGEFPIRVGKQYYVQVEFLDVEPDIHQLLAEHINYVINKTGMSRNFAIPA